MLIKIDIQITDFIPENHSKDFYVFSEVARVSREGYHRFIIGRDLSEKIIKFFTDKEYIYQYDRLGDKYATLGYTKNPSIPVLELEYGNKPLDKIEENKWRIGHHQFIDKRYHEQTVLLCEGYSDCDFYEFLFHVDAKRKNLGAVNFDPHQTGGSGNMKRGIIHHAKRRIVVCILDSDKKTPFDNPSESYKIAKTYLDEKKHIGFVTHTPGRETENFLPIEVAESISSEENKKHTNNLMELIDKQGPENSVASLDCVSIYYDFKDGLNEQNIENLINCTKNCVKEWAERKYATTDIDKDLPSYGKNLVELFVRNDQAKENFRMKMDETFWKLHFDQWNSEFCWYFCGEEKQRP